MPRFGGNGGVVVAVVTGTDVGVGRGVEIPRIGESVWFSAGGGVEKEWLWVDGGDSVVAGVEKCRGKTSEHEHH